MTVPTATTGSELSTCYAQVLMPIDFSNLSWRALPLARSMAKAFNVPRRLLHVDTSSPWLDEGASRLVLRPAPGGEPVEVEVLAARSAAGGILRALGDDESSLLVMSTHGHSAVAELALGSTAEELLQAWRGAMLVTGPKFRSVRTTFSRIVLCVDPATSPPVRLVEDVRAWAERMHLPIVVLSICDYSALIDVELIRDDQQRLNSLADVLEVDGLPAEIVRLHGGRAAGEIVQYVDAMPGTVVAMTTHARSVSSRLVLGSVAMAVVRQSTSPILLRRFVEAEH